MPDKPTTKNEIVTNVYDGELIAQYPSEPFVAEVNDEGNEIYATTAVSVRVHGSNEAGYALTTDDDADGSDEAPETVYASRAEAITAGVAFAKERGGDAE